MGDNKPVIQAMSISAGLTTFFKALMALAVSLEWIDAKDSAALITFADIAFPLLVTAGTAWWLTRKTTSLEQPTDTDGVRMVRAEPDHPPALAEQKKIEKDIFARSIQR